MPRPGPRRPLLGVKITSEGIAAIDAAAEKEGVSRSDWVRAALSAGLARPPTVRRYLKESR